ncbi:hypothetical protein V2J09_015688 [Rumex salicifolius]
MVSILSSTTPTNDSTSSLILIHHKPPQPAAKAALTIQLSAFGPPHSVSSTTGFTTLLHQCIIVSCIPTKNIALLNRLLSFLENPDPSIPASMEASIPSPTHTCRVHRKIQAMCNPGRTEIKKLALESLARRRKDRGNRRLSVEMDDYGCVFIKASMVG